MKLMVKIRLWKENVMEKIKEVTINTTAWVLTLLIMVGMIVMLFSPLLICVLDKG